MRAIIVIVIIIAIATAIVIVITTAIVRIYANTYTRTGSISMV